MDSIYNNNFNNQCTVIKADTRQTDFVSECTKAFTTNQGDTPHGSHNYNIIALDLNKTIVKGDSCHTGVQNITLTKNAKDFFEEWSNGVSRLISKGKSKIVLYTFGKDFDTTIEQIKTVDSKFETSRIKKTTRFERNESEKSNIFQTRQKKNQTRQKTRSDRS